MLDPTNDKRVVETLNGLLDEFLVAHDMTKESGADRGEMFCRSIINDMVVREMDKVRTATNHLCAEASRALQEQREAHLRAQAHHDAEVVRLCGEIPKMAVKTVEDAIAVLQASPNLKNVTHYDMRMVIDQLRKMVTP